MALLDKKGILDRGIGMFYSQLKGQFASEEEFWTMLAAHCLKRLKKLRGEDYASQGMEGTEETTRSTTE